MANLFRKSHSLQEKFSYRLCKQNGKNRISHKKQKKKKNQVGCGFQLKITLYFQKMEYSPQIISLSLSKLYMEYQQE